MNFDDFLSHSDHDEYGQKEQTALIIYYLETVEEQNDVTTSAVKEVIQDSRLPISNSSVSPYFRRLREKGWIKPTGASGYRLTHTGKREIEKGIDDEALDNPRDEDDLFLDIDDIEDERYEQLVDDINETYRYRIYDATIVLARKFFEDLVFQILRTQYAGESNEMFYDQENDQHYSFGELISNLKDGITKEGATSLRQYDRSVDTDIAEDLRELKDAGNLGAHKIRIEFDDQDMEDFSDDATRIGKTLYYILEGARIANDN